MAEARLEFSLGSLGFVAEGGENWVAHQLDKVLAAVPDLLDISPSTVERTNENDDENDVEDHSPGTFTTTLAAYIREKGGESNQVQRFLATADWLRRRGTSTLTTTTVSKTLKNNQQKKLGNPSDCLNKNIAKGYCEKLGNGFFITPDGLAHLKSG